MLVHPAGDTLEAMNTPPPKRCELPNNGMQRTPIIRRILVVCSRGAADAELYAPSPILVP
jgi:hypothetical protein